MRAIVARLSAQPHETLGALAELCYRYPTFYGFDYQASGVLVLKGENINREGELVDVEEPSFISEEIHARFPLTHLELDDLIISVRGEVGKVGLISPRLAGSNINANTIRVALKERVKGKDYEPRFIWLYLNSDLGQLLIGQFIAGGVQETITAPELLEVMIPKLPHARQVKLVAAMDAARAERRAKLVEADALLAGLDGFLLATVGLTAPPKDNRKVYAARRADVPARFDPHFHLPALAQNTRMLTAGGAEPLGSLVSFSDEIWKPAKHEKPTFRYIEISNVNPNTGEACAEEVPVVEAPSRARMAVQTNDIIVSLTRPHHGSIAQITSDLNGCIASTGFSVLRGIEGSRLNREYLWCVLRSKMCLLQMLQRASGGNYPAITERELAKVLLPVPKPAVQETIATEACRRREAARRLRAEAETDWQAAKQWFEEQLLGGVL